MDSTIGATPGGQKRRDEFWTAELQRQVEYREKCYKKWKYAIGIDKLPLWIKHQEAAAQVRRAKLENDNYCKTTATIKRIRQHRTIQPTYSHIDGPTAAAHSMAQHLEKEYNGHLLNSQKLTTSTSSYSTDDKEFPITEEGAPDNPANFRPISLTSVFRKILEYCIKTEVQTYSPELDVAQSGFRPARSTLQQVLCLQELSRIHKDKYKTLPTLAFLDIQSAYNTMDREVIWDTIKSTIPPFLFAILKQLFNNVYIEVIISNATSYRFHSVTGVLQGIPINYKGQLDGKQLIERNTISAEKGFQLLSSIGISPSGISKLLSVCIYTQFIRPKLEYGLAIITPNKKQQHALELVQNNCICHIYGAHSHSSTTVMCHMHKLPSMKERTSILQTKFLLNINYLPDDSLLSLIIPHINQHSKSQWQQLKKSQLWQQLPDPKEDTTESMFKATKCLFLMNELEKKLNATTGSKPTSKKKIEFWKNIWPTLCMILAEIDAHQHPDSNQQQYYDLNPGVAFIKWIDPPSEEQPG
ncbi:hypothetical protein INT45_008154 [Circinella minor]|uniref:Reverse transcriptase domain-containing protein n=1 Tax=Circinella minor TaxID=1195481 RepID=A0A8H7VHC3_9FUNG|nr:hypothetical protein INT45_008154 [Circinella minor]